MNESKDKINNEELASSKGKIFSKIVYFLFIVLFIWILGQLFLKTEVSDSIRVVKNFIFKSELQSNNKITDLKIIYPQYNPSLEPTLADPTSRQSLVNIYEPLVKQGVYLNLIPCLALSYGLIDEYTWEFILRPNVKFQDGSTFEVNDVVASLKRAQTYPSSELVTLIESIGEVKIIDDYTLQIKTKTPDPLLLNKLSSILIVPSEYEGKEILKPVGTGPYAFDSLSEEKDIMKFKVFEDYWGNKPKFKTITIISIFDKSDRVNDFIQGKADLLAFVPLDTVDEIKSRNFQIATMPAWEVQYLVFNVNSEFLKDPLQRKTVSLAIDQKTLIASLGQYVREVSQFVSNGVFGFNSNIKEHEYDLKQAKILAEETGLKGKTLKFHLPIGLELLGEHVRKSLSDVGVFVVVSYLEFDKLLASMDNKEADIYFLGFKSGFGDSVEFLQSMVYSKGDFNLFGYNNPDVDHLIEDALVEFNQYKRRDDLQEAMRIIVEDDVVGIPLFEYESVFSFVDEIDFKPRIDGLIYFDEINVK